MNARGGSFLGHLVFRCPAREREQERVHGTKPFETARGAGECDPCDPFCRPLIRNRPINANIRDFRSIRQRGRTWAHYALQMHPQCPHYMMNHSFSHRWSFFGPARRDLTLSWDTGGRVKKRVHAGDHIVDYLSDTFPSSFQCTPGYRYAVSGPQSPQNCQERGTL
jgi:hypothetical protein